MIIIGYQGIGKSTICKNNPKYIDFESSVLKVDGCRLHNWQIPYCQMAIWLSQQGYVVFTSSHKEVREILKDCCEYCVAIIPSKELKKQWIEKLFDRYKKSGLEKDRNAYLNAVDRYEENLAEIEEDIAETVLIDSMDYDLQWIVSKCELRIIPQSTKEEPWTYWKLFYGRKKIDTEFGQYIKCGDCGFEMPFEWVIPYGEERILPIECPCCHLPVRMDQTCGGVKRG